MEFVILPITFTLCPSRQTDTRETNITENSIDQNGGLGFNLLPPPV